MAKQNTRQVSIFINGKEVENTIKSIAAEQAKLNNSLRTMVRGTDEYESKVLELRRVNGILREHNDGLRSIKNGWDLTKVGVDKFVGVAAGAFAVDSLIGYGKQLFGVGVQMDALNRKAQTVFGATLPAVTAEAKKNAEAMGLTTTQYVQAAAAIQDILIPMGFQRKEASDISTQLVNLSGALSEWTGGQVSATEVSDILSSALTGERERLKQLGIVLQQSDIDARLAEKGQSKLTGTMKQQAEAAATLELVLEKSTDAQAAFENSTGSAVRRQAELAAKTQEVVEKLSTLLLPVFERLADVAGILVGGVSDVVDAIGAITNPAKAASEAFDNQAQKVSDLESNIVPLLDRYEELANKSNRSKAEQDELQKIITTVAGVVPLAVTEFDKYGKAIGINTDKVREFIEVEKARLKFVNESAIKENESLKNQLEKEAQIFQQRLNNRKVAETSTTGGGPLGGGISTTTERNLTNEELQSLQTDAAKLQERLVGVNAELARLKGENITTPGATTPENPQVTGGGGDPEKAKKEAERIQKELTDLLETVAQRRRDLLAKEQEDELAIVINGIEDRYNKEIAKALELEKKGVTEATAQRITLEQLKQQEIGDAVTAYTEKSIEEAQKQAYDKAKAVAQAEADAARESQDFLDQRQKEREDAQKQIEEFKLSAVEDARAVEIQKLQEHYNELLKVAEDYGIDTTGLKEAQEKQLAEITKKYAEEEAKKQYETNQKRLEALSGLFSNFGNLVSSTFDLLGAEGEKSAAFQKVATLAKIAFDTASAISSLVAASEANPANAVTFGAAAIAQYVSGIARIISNIAQAKKVLSAAPTVKQKASGRYLTVTGDADGRQYNASVIPTPYTGLLPNHPVLFQSQATGQPVLASERGAEYFVSAEALRNPYVANLTRMIDNISMAGRGVPQFADGGVNTATSTAATTPAGIDPALVANLNSAITTLNNLLSRGIVAVIPDQTLTNIPKRLGKINDASGGYFG